VDTVPLVVPGTTVIRWLPHLFVGKTLYHCHVLPHSSLGMAAILELVQMTCLLLD
jgi:FtsP/CotA-like multicopper oxidase with cupredoxin domain